MDKEIISIISASKDGSHFCTAPHVREQWVSRSGPPFSDQSQDHDMTSFLKHHLSNYHFSALEHQSKLKLNLPVRVPLKSILQTYEYIQARGDSLISGDFVLLEQHKQF